MFGQDVTQLAVMALIALAAGGLVFAFIAPMLSGDAASKRVNAIASNQKGAGRQNVKSKILEESKDQRRKAIQDSLNQIGETQRANRKRMTLRAMLDQTGVEISTRLFWILSAVAGAVLTLATVIFGLPWFVWIAAFVVGTFGLPRWVIKFLRNRRQQVFLNDFADAVDVMVRGLKAGLPVNDAMRVIASESGEPVGPEFAEVVEGQRVGITIDQGIERMVDRMPLAEVQFLAIVMSIQAKTGGNLSEALNNLSKVLRDRKKMKSKIRAVSQEAKSSAAIIGALPFCIMGALWLLNPDYLHPLFSTRIGNIILTVSGGWMLTGVIVMKKMINIDI